MAIIKHDSDHSNVWAGGYITLGGLPVVLEQIKDNSAIETWDKGAQTLIMSVSIEAKLTPIGAAHFCKYAKHGINICLVHANESVYHMHDMQITQLQLETPGNKLKLIAQPQEQSEQLITS